MSAPDSTPSDYAGLSKQEVAERLKNPTPDATPRTDMLAFLIPHPLMYGKRETQFVSADFARTLERELTAAKAEIAAGIKCNETLQACIEKARQTALALQSRAERAEAGLRERTQWQCKCGGTDCAGQAENERLRAEVERLKAQDGFHWNIIKGCMDELEMVDMGPSMIRGEIQEWKCSHERVKAKEVAATDRAVLLAVERDQLRARVADLENDLEKSKHEADDWHRAWETVTEQAKKEVTELEQDKADLTQLLRNKLVEVQEQQQGVITT